MWNRMDALGKVISSRTPDLALKSMKDAFECRIRATLAFSTAGQRPYQSVGASPNKCFVCCVRAREHGQEHGKERSRSTGERMSERLGDAEIEQ